MSKETDKTLEQVMKDIEKYEKNISLFITKNEDKND